MTRMSRYTAEDKQREALREVALRKRVYARMQMNDQESQRRIGIMQEIADDYGELAQLERLL
jgi:hypothetical protein